MKKKLLTTLSTMSILTLISNSSINIINTTAVNALTAETSIKNDVTSLFNKQWNDLDNSDWITNQATTDHKFYSYDTTALKNYTFPNARHAFLVDTTGNLIDNDKVTVPEKEKANIANTKQEMITARKITSIKDNHNPYSNSQYSNSYFTGDNTDWQYIQLGGVDKHIDISQQQGASNVKNATDLSESLGLYYICQAAIAKKIDKNLAEQLGLYFINHSSLKQQISDQLVTKLIDLVVDRKNLYDFIKNMPFYISNKNFSLNYIFDKNNSLVEIYYNEWKNNSNASNNLNYNWHHYYDGWHSRDKSNHYTLLNWKQYATNWNDFMIIYSKFLFSKDSYLQIADGDDVRVISNLATATNNIKTDQGSGDVNSVFNVEINEGLLGGGNLSLNIWHDDNNIYYMWFYWSTNLNINIDIELVNVTFNNVMN